jgi:hypothetical protein
LDAASAISTTAGSNGAHRQRERDTTANAPGAAGGNTTGISILSPDNNICHFRTRAAHLFHHRTAYGYWLRLERDGDTRISGDR